MSKFVFLRFGLQVIRSRFAWLLLPFSCAWNGFSRLRHFLYDVGFFETHKVAVPVISIGNIAVGGTGKTPLVIELAKAFSPKSVAILLRGYGSDEEYVLKNHLPTAAIYAHPNRVTSAKLAIKNGAEIILLDDGFQHRKLARTVDVVIVRQEDLTGRCLPAGVLRDPPSRLQKADIVLRDTDLQAKVLRILTLDRREGPPLAGEPIGLFCGIGSPEKFKKTLLSLGAKIEAEWILADHEPVEEYLLRAFYDRCKRLNVKYLVCTEKDAVKLKPTSLPILFVEIGLEIQGFEKLMAKIEERMYASVNQ